MNAYEANIARRRWPLDYVNITLRFDREVAIRERLRVLGPDSCPNLDRVLAA